LFKEVHRLFTFIFLGVLNIVLLVAAWFDAGNAVASLRDKPQEKLINAQFIACYTLLELLSYTVVGTSLPKDALPTRILFFADDFGVM